MSAAKQGLSAQISQASEDAKRAVLNRTSLTTSLWFSNLNTTCTIKSAPPRTPEVLSLLSTKSGWLFKRNEQHVWQTRWCCVVPHTFLYYFDANVLPGEAQPPVPSAAIQDDWNQAVANGYGHHKKGKQSAPRSSLYLFPNTNTNTKDGTNNGDGHYFHDDAPSPTHTASHPTPFNTQNTTINHGVAPTHAPSASDSNFASMQPAGIIDLECYTSVHRSQANQLVLELAGDDAVNPDLRQFYFSAGSEGETEAWTQALLGQRHTALMDETDAYKQVCDGFAQQLQVLHGELDRFQKAAEDAQDELYQVRSEMEDGRRNCWKLVEEVLDRHAQQQQELRLQQQQQANKDGDDDDDSAQIIPASLSFRAELDAIRSQDISLLAPIQLLSDYTRVLEDSATTLQKENKTLQEQLTTASNSDHNLVQQLQQQLEETQAELHQQSSTWAHEKQVLQQKCDTSTKELEDLNKDLASTRMEITMYQSSTRNKIVELQNHKKILKKEVLDLRQKLEDALSELSLVTHKEKSHRLEVDQERKKAELLERYVDKMESQVKVQQNMMEMMSASGMASVHGGASHYEVTVPRTVHSPRSINSNRSNNGGGGNNNNVVLVNTPIDVGADKNVVHIHDDDAAGIQMPMAGNSGKQVAGGDGPDVDCDNDVDVEGLVSRHHHRHRLPSPLLRGRSAGMMEDDNKSHMSELTEDRTQKQFDALQYLRDMRERELEANHRGPTPPAYILGANGGRFNSGGNPILQQHQQQLLQNFQNPENAKLDTINSSATIAVTTPSRMMSGPDNLPRSNRASPNNPPHHVMVENNINPPPSSGGIGSRSLGAGVPGRLSVAQRARLEADRASTPIKLRLDAENTQQFLQQQRSGGSVMSTPPPTSPPRKSRPERRPSTSSRTSTGFFSNIGRKLEAAIDKSVFSVDVHVDPNHPDDEELSSDTGDSDDDDDLSRDPADPNSDDGGGYNHDNDPRHDRHDRNNGRDHTSSSRGPALLTQETLDGNSNSNNNTNSNNRGSQSVVATPTRTKVISPKNSTSSLGSFRRYDCGSSVMSDEKKTPTTPDRIRVRNNQSCVCILGSILSWIFHAHPPRRLFFFLYLLLFPLHPFRP